MQKFYAILLAFCLNFTQVLALETDYPQLSGRVVDEAGVLTENTKQRLNEILSVDHNNQVAVVILKDLRGMDGRQYGINLARNWQLGQKDKDNGVLIYLSQKDRYAGIEVGYGLEGVLPDSLTGRILREFVLPPLKNGNDYNQAVLNAASAVMAVISKDNSQAEENSGEEDLWSVLFFLLLLYLMSKKNGGFRGGGGFFLPRGGFRGGRFTGGGGRFGGGGAGGRF